MKRARYLVFVSFVSLTVVLGGRLLLLPTVAQARTLPGPNVVNIVAREYQFLMPDTLPAGPTLFRLKDEGQQLHHATLIRLEHGKTVADLTSLPPGPFPKWAVFMGGPNAPMPHGGEDEDIVNLSPGNYAVVCLIPGRGGKPHLMDGMVKALTVTPATEARRMPASDLTLTLTSYRFSFSKTPTAGKHIIRIVNKGNQMHEAELFRLAKGKTGEDVFKWVNGGMQGPPPGAPVGGMSPESPGRKNLLMVDLTNGNYAMLCFLPDTRDGKLHAAHGMIYDFKVI